MKAESCVSDLGGFDQPENVTFVPFISGYITKLAESIETHCILVFASDRKFFAAAISKTTAAAAAAAATRMNAI